MGGLKTGPSRRHRIQPAEGPVLDPRAKETCFKKGQKVDPLEIKSGPSWRAFFSFVAADIALRLGPNIVVPPGGQAGILNWGGPFLRACFFLRFEVQKRAPSVSYCFAPISMALRPSRPASKPALTCCVLFSMVSRHWSSRLALRPASNFVSSYIFLVWQHRHRPRKVQRFAGTSTIVLYSFRVPMSLALSLCQYVLRPRRGLAEPRSASIACFGNATSCINIIERRYKRLVLGFVFGT